MEEETKEIVETVEAVTEQEEQKDSIEYVFTSSLKEYEGINIQTSEEDYNNLKQDIIKRNKIMQPLQVYKKIVLAGNTRLRIAKEIGFKFVPVMYLDNDMTDLDQKEYVITDNLSRRHLTTIQKSDLALELEVVEKGRAEERKKKADKDKKRDGNGAFSTSHVKIDMAGENPLKSSSYLFEEGENEPVGSALEFAAKRAGISYGTAYKAKTIKTVSPAIYEEVLTGDKSLDEGYQIAKEIKRNDNPKSEKLFKQKTAAQMLKETDKYIIKPKKTGKDAVVETANMLYKLMSEINAQFKNDISNKTKILNEEDLTAMRAAIQPLCNELEIFNKKAGGN